MKRPRFRPGKNIFKLPYVQEDDAWLLTYPKKHPILMEAQRRYNHWFGGNDKRRINTITQHTNRLGETWLFGRYGHGKEEVVVTIGQIIAPRFIKLEEPGEPISSDV